MHTGARKEGLLRSSLSKTYHGSLEICPQGLTRQGRTKKEIQKLNILTLSGDSKVLNRLKQNSSNMTAQNSVKSLRSVNSMGTEELADKPGHRGHDPSGKQGEMCSMCKAAGGGKEPHIFRIQ